VLAAETQTTFKPSFWRHGPTGTVTLHFEGATTKFSNYVSEDHVPAH